MAFRTKKEEAFIPHSQCKQLIMQVKLHTLKNKIQRDKSDLLFLFHFWVQTFSQASPNKVKGGRFLIFSSRLKIVVQKTVVIDIYQLKVSPSLNMSFQSVNYIKLIRRMEKTLQKAQKGQSVHEQKMLLKSKRRSKRAEIRESFSCQCGKIYLSFSALYLHAKNKHNYKLTTKISEDVCKIERTQGLIKYSYFLVQKNNSHSKQQSHDCSKHSPPDSRSFICQQNTQERREPDNYFQEYLASLEDHEERETIKDFISFFEGQQPQQEQPSDDRIRGLPYLFNPFMLELVTDQALPAYSPKWRTKCKHLWNLGEWLRAQNLTELVVINEAE